MFLQTFRLTTAQTDPDSWSSSLGIGTVARTRRLNDSQLLRRIEDSSAARPMPTGVHRELWSVSFTATLSDVCGEVRGEVRGEVMKNCIGSPQDLTLGPFDTAARAARARHLCLAEWSPHANSTLQSALHGLQQEQVAREVNRQAVLAGQCTSRYRGVQVLGDNICVARIEQTRL